MSLSPELRERLEKLLLLVALLGLLVGGIAWGLGQGTIAAWAWGIVTAIVLARTSALVLKGFLNRELGVDLIAVLAMAGSLALGEWLAGAIIAVMVTGGEALERYAAGRAQRELSALLERAPRLAHLIRDGEIVDVDPKTIQKGDRLLVRPSEIVPVDGIVGSEGGVLDASAITGESRPVSIHEGEPIRSGVVNLGGPLEIIATASSEESTYAAIIRLVREASASKAPFVRLADRYAFFFLIATLWLAGGAWIASGDPVRALAVVVVATPCPLILAVPVALVAGISRAARHGIIIKGGAALEQLARGHLLLLDKTGTVTSGKPRIAGIESFGAFPPEELLRLAASLEQISTHPFAPSIVAAARDRGLELVFPEDAFEKVGLGVVGLVSGLRVAVGQLVFVAPDETRSAAARSIDLRASIEGSAPVFISVGGKLVGALIVEDPIRPEAPRVLHALRRAGISRIHMVTGDHPDVAELVGDAIGVDRVLSERTPDEKVVAVEAMLREGATIMVGDGVNDAPALALADVGVAMGARGASAAAEAADVVLTSDRLEGLLVAIRIARRSRRIARESALFGIGASIVAMIAAALGYLSPVAGALLQEGIDLVVILNALRALGAHKMPTHKAEKSRELALSLHEKHEELRPRIEMLASLATRLELLSPEEARRQLEETRDFLKNELLPHEQEEERRAYPVVVSMLPGEESLMPLVQTHREITRLVRLFSRLVDRVSEGAQIAGELRDLRRVLYGLHAILTLHFAQEDELYAVLEQEGG